MKKMKTIKYLGFFLATFFIALACTNEDIDEVLKIQHTGGLLTVNSLNVNYVVGNPGPYSVNLVAAHGSNPTTTIEVYNTFVNNVGERSNTVLLKTIELTQSITKEPVNFTVNFTELINGIVFDGEPLSASDADLSIGDGFNLTYVAKTASGDLSDSVAKTKMTVSTRFAGKYKVITGQYWRIGVPRPDLSWTASILAIESVDAITYKHNGLAVWTDQEYWFTIEGTDITVLPTNPAGEPVLLNGQPIQTCELNGSNLTNVNCGSSNYVVLDDVNGKDKIFITVGYLSPDGPREFYEVLEKIVD